MSVEKQSRSNFDDNEFAWFERTQAQFNQLKEPAIVNAVDQAKELDEHFRNIPQTKDEILEKVSSLNGLLAPWYDRTLFAKGKIEYFGRSGRAQEAILWDSQVKFDGFGVMLLDEDAQKLRAKIVYGLKVPTDNLPIRYESKFDTVQAYADLDALELDSREATPERAINWLSMMHPDLLEHYDKLLTHTTPTMKALELLQGLEVSKWSEITSELARNCLATFLNTKVPFDTHIPYVVGISGHYHVRHPLNQSYVPVEYEYSGLVDELSFGFEKQSAKLQRDRPWQLTLGLRAHYDDRAIPPHYFKIPLASIISLYSVRDAFYGSSV